MHILKAVAVWDLVHPMPPEVTLGLAEERSCNQVRRSRTLQVKGLDEPLRLIKVGRPTPLIRVLFDDG
jgi:hypothetical protein